MRLTGYAILLGGILLGISTLLHPLVYNPWNVQWVLPEVIQHYWIWDHIMMLIGITVWLSGLASVSVIHHNKGVIWHPIVIFYSVSLTVWVMILSMELGVIPPLGRTALKHSHDCFIVLWTALFSYGLFSGYVAMLFAYLGLYLFAHMLSKGETQKTFGQWGNFSSFIGTLGILFTFFKPNWALPILVLTTIPPFFWTLFLGFYCLKMEKI